MWFDFFFFLLLQHCIFCQVDCRFVMGFFCRRAGPFNLKGKLHVYLFKTGKAERSRWLVETSIKRLQPIFSKLLNQTVDETKGIVIRYFF